MAIPSASPPFISPPPPPLPPNHRHTLSPYTFSPPPTTVKPQTPTIRSRLSRICQEGNPHLARQLFDTIPRPTTVLWNTIIIGLICNNLPLEALLFYAQMKKSSPLVQPDPYTYSSTLKACAETRDLRTGKAIHCHFIRCLSNPSRIVYNSLLNMYAVCLKTTSSEMGFDDYDAVRKVFDSLRKRNVVAWNTIISWYVKTERYVEALRMFRMMLRMGIKPSTVSFVNVFPALSALRDFKNVDILYGLVLKSGDEYVNDLFVVSSAMFTYSELGCIDIARKIFNSCVDKNTEVWNTMIGGYVQNNNQLKSIELFLVAMESEQTVLDDVTFLLALTAVSQLQNLGLGKQLHAYLVKTMAKIPVIIVNAIIVMYSRCSSVHTSFEVFNAMQERDIVSWNTIISALVQNDLNDEGIMLVYEMQKQGFVIDSVTATALLSAASNLRNSEVGKQTHGFLVRNAIHFEGMNSYLIDMYAKSGLINVSERLFMKSLTYERDQATWNSMLSGYTQNGLIEKSFVTFRQMQEQNLVPNAITIASILPSCGPLGDLVKQLHGFSVRNLLVHNIFVSTALVDMYSKSGEIQYSENIFAKICERNSVTYTSMIFGYGQHGMGEKALSLFHSMQESGVEPDTITFVAILSACNYSGLVEEGIQIFNSMEIEYNIQPSTEHFCCVADMLGRVGRVTEAYDFVEGLGEAGNTAEIWGSVLGACRIYGFLKLGEAVADKLVKLDKGNMFTGNKGNNFTGYHVLLSNMYAEEGNWSSVDKVRKQMREKGLRKEVGCSWIKIGDCVNCFVSKDREHFYIENIYEMLEGLATEMKDPYSVPSRCSSLEIDILKFYE